MARRASKLGIYQQIRLLELFVGGVMARTAAELVEINRHSATLYYQKIREMIAAELENECPFDGEIEIDESYFGGQRKPRPRSGGENTCLWIVKAWRKSLRQSDSRCVEQNFNPHYRAQNTA